MSVKVKIGVILLLLLCMFAGLNYGVQRVLVYPQLVKIEKSEALAELNRISKAIENELKALEQFSRDWGNWDDTYFYLLDKNKEYEESNLGETTFEDNNLTHISLIDSSGKIVFSRSIDVETGKEFHMNSLKGKSVELASKIYSMPLKLPITGFFLSEKVPMLLVVTPVFKSEDKSHSTGSIVMGRPIHTDFLQKIQDQTGSQFDLKVKSSSQDPKATTWIESKDQYKLSKELLGMNGLYSLGISTVYQRDIAKEGKRSLETIIYVNVVAFIFVFLMVQLLIHRLILKPVSSMVEKAKKTRRKIDLKADENVFHDEVQEMIFELNYMVEHIQVQNAHLEKSNIQLTELARLDELTGVLNRRVFNETLDKEWSRLFREGKPLSVIMADIDHFKLFNDKFGHQCGDDVLIRVAKCLEKNALRSADVATRYGGEEFAIILPNTNLKGAMALAEIMRKEISHISIQEKDPMSVHSISASFGVASVVPREGIHCGDLVRAADKALYQAKANGRNRVKSASDW